MSAFIKHIDYKSSTYADISPNEIDCIVLIEKHTTFLSFRKESKLIALKVFLHKDKDSKLFNGDDFKNILPDNSEFKTCLVLLGAEKSTLIPTDAFDAFSAENYITFNFGKLLNETVIYENINELNIHQVYAIDRSYKYMINTVFPNSQIKHQKSVLLEKYFRHNESKNNMYVHTRQHCFDIFVFEGNKLILSNTFFYNSAQDYIYFLMQTFMQLELNPEKQALFLTGEIEKEGALYTLISKYVRYVEFIQDKLGDSIEIEDIPYHYFYNILL